jgi:hypothetical protein
MRRTSRWLSDQRRTLALVVALPEDWAVAEAIELYTSLRESLAIPLGPPLLNGVFPRRFSRQDEALLREAEASDAIDPRLLAAGRYFVARREAARVHGKALRAGTGARPLELPFVFSCAMRWDDLDPVARALEPAIGESRRSRAEQAPA